MTPVYDHSWNISKDQAIALQEELANKVEREDRFNKIQLVAGVDVAYSKESDQLLAAIVILDMSNLEVVETSTAVGKESFPYIPGLFSFREIPPLIKAFENLKHVPDLIVCDGQGYAHPRRFGLACHLGVIYDVPTIGCGKNLLIGEHQDPDKIKGSRVPIIDGDEIVGSVLRTQDNVKPVYVSIGHRVSLTTACDLVLKLSPDYRLPETTRKADQLVNINLKKHDKNNYF